MYLIHKTKPSNMTYTKTILMLSSVLAVTACASGPKIEEAKYWQRSNASSSLYLQGPKAQGKQLDRWDTPARDGFLHSEHMDYHDFESCMMAKGWERVEYLPYDKAALARQQYLDQYAPKKKKSSFGARENVTTLEAGAQRPPPYKNTNQ